VVAERRGIANSIHESHFMRKSSASSAHDRNADIALRALIRLQPADAFGKPPPLRDIGKVFGVLAMERVPPPEASGQQDEQQ
jgi:hypothetical protein